MTKLSLSLLAGAGALALMIWPQARADEWNKKTVFTFSAPVEVPGRVLPAGSYVFKLADSQSDRHIVQVFNTRENHLYGTFLTVPQYRAETPDKPMIVFEERAADSPQAIKAWFYPGDNYGDEFIYHHKPVEMASAATPAPTSTMTEQPETGAQEPVASEPETLPSNESAMNEEPNTNEEEQAQAVPPPPAEPQTAPPAEPLPSETAPPEDTTQLPATASGLPLAGLIGLLSLGAGWSLRQAARRIG